MASSPFAQLCTGDNYNLDGTLLLYDALRPSFDPIRIGKDPECPTCAARLLFRAIAGG